ncbi:MAG: hypothetical protein R3Y63_11795 [Eubacteriales bacterium]
MDFILARIATPSRNLQEKHRIILTNKKLYDTPDNLKSAVIYNPETLIDPLDEWYKIEHFSTTDFCLAFLKSDINSVDFSDLDKKNSKDIKYICSCQDDSSMIYFQKVLKSHLSKGKCLELGSTFNLKDDTFNITINTNADAIYEKVSDFLYFKNLERIAAIFPGIESLYIEATTEETTAFLNSNLISTTSNFSASDVKRPNRKKIALANLALNHYDDEQKAAVIANFKEYCQELVLGNKLTISNETELELVLYGILQRFYTTADGREQRIANSVKIHKRYTGKTD